MSLRDAVATVVEYIVQLTRPNALAAEDARPIEARKLAGAIAVDCLKASTATLGARRTEGVG